MKTGIHRGWSLRQKVFFWSFLSFAVFITLMIPFSERVVDGIVRKSLQRYVSEMIKELEKCDDVPCMVSYLENQENFVFFRVSLIDGSLNVLYDVHMSHAEAGHVLPLSPEDREEIQIAKKEGKAYVVGVSKEYKEKLALIAQKFTVQGQEYILRASTPFTQVEFLMKEFRVGLYTVDTLFMIAFVVTVGWVFYRLTRPMRQISDLITPYAEGQIDTLPKIQLSSHISNDFDRFVHTLNSLSEKIRKEIRNVVEERNEKESILDSLVEGVIAIDGEGIVRYVNPTFAKILGLQRREIFGRKIAHLAPPKPEPLARCLALIKLSQQQKSVVTDSIALEETQRVFLDLIVVPKPYRSGSIVVIQDKSSQHQVVEMGKEFIANASHELRTPITIIKGFAETLQDLPSISASMLKEITEKIVRNCQRMDNLVKNLLTLADLEHVPESRFQPSDLVALVENCVHFLHTRSPEAKVAIEKIQERVVIDSYPDLLELALMNLLENAVKYSHPPADLTVTLKEEENVAILSIQDKGIGIPAEDLPHIFERFYTVDKAHSRRLGGAGLGLSIVKTIIDKHEGSISVASTLGKGTTFTITLPKSRR